MLILASNMSNFPRRLRGGLLRLAGLFLKNGKEQDLSEEMESHLSAADPGQHPIRNGACGRPASGSSQTRRHGAG